MKNIINIFMIFECVYMTLSSTIIKNKHTHTFGTTIYSYNDYYLTKSTFIIEKKKSILHITLKQGEMKFKTNVRQTIQRNTVQFLKEIFSILCEITRAVKTSIICTFITTVFC